MVAGQTGDNGNSAPATVNGKTASLLLDIGCGVPLIFNSRLVRKRFYTGKTIRVRYLNGHVETLPQASIVVETRYVKGRVTAAVSKGMTQGLTLELLRKANVLDRLSHQKGGNDNRNHW